MGGGRYCFSNRGGNRIRDRSRSPGAPGLDFETWDSNRSTRCSSERPALARTAKRPKAAKPRLPHRRWSVVIRAAHVVAALRAHQLAAVPDEPMGAVGTHLAVMIDWRLLRPSRLAARTGM